MANGDIWPIDKQSKQLMNGPPRLDQMGPGDIYMDGGSQGGNQATYSVPKPREEVQNILDEYGYTDFEKSRDLKKRQKHIKKVKDLTGVSNVENEDDYVYGPGGKDERFDEQRMKGVERWLSADPRDKAMVTQVAKGEMFPDEFREAKTKQAMSEEQELMGILNAARGELVGDIPKRGGFMTKDGVRTPTTSEGVESFIRGDEGTGVEFEGSKSIQKIISSGGGRQGGDKTKVPPKPTSSLGKDLNEKLKIFKGIDLTDPLYLESPAYKNIESDIRKIRTAQNLQEKAGGVMKMPDVQAKNEANDFIAAGDIINDILKDFDTYPVLKEQFKDPKEAAQHFKQKLDSIQSPTMHNRIIALVNKGHSFEDIFKTISGATGQKRYQVTDGE